jgi:diaminohydroxyphosphoribosylaminopyrimidine deaminase / 5-amino-6-(5-phosphoribosylamino)uracil reductase
MRRALALAARGKRTWPNPKVGCVLVKNGRVVGQGFHQLAGGPHAEALALAQAGEKARGATAYVTLEPCCAHPGKRTPPCSDALADAGVSRVFAAMKDPNPGVSGRGLRILENAGIRAETGLLETEAERLNRSFVWRMRHKRPFIILKSALSLDGKAFARGGASKWITGPAARGLVHTLRAEVDAVLVGVGTVLADDPLLTSHGAGPDPVPVVLDSRLRTPKRAKILRGPKHPLVYSCKAGRLKGAEVVRVSATGGRPDLKAVLFDLASRGLGTLLVEGGPTVQASFLALGYVDEVYAFFSPKLLGGVDDPNAAPRLAQPRLSRVGSDFLFCGRLEL